jgi:hypothetical protein
MSSRDPGEGRALVTSPFPAVSMTEDPADKSKLGPNSFRLPPPSLSPLRPPSSFLHDSRSPPISGVEIINRKNHKNRHVFLFLSKKIKFLFVSSGC